MKASTSGFTLIEMIVTVAIIASLAAILVPIVSGELADTGTATAQGETRRIGTALNQFFKDVSFAPTGPGGNNTIEFLVGSGTVPDPNGFNDDGGAGADADTYLTNGSANGGSQWKGPYLAEIEPDPWGNAYMINVHGYYDAAEFVWVISAGPNGTMDTAPSDTLLQGDDLGILVD